MRGGSIIISRRRAVTGMAALLVFSSGIPPVHAACLNPLAIERLAQALGPLSSVMVIGQSCLERLPADFSTEKLMRGIWGRLADFGFDVARATNSELKKVVGEMIDADLMSGRQFAVSGWILAQSEAEISMLYVKRRWTGHI